MANLETLYIEIDGSAQKANDGVNTLINSLSALGTKVDEVCGQFKELVKQIQSLSNIGNIRMPSVGAMAQTAQQGVAGSSAQQGADAIVNSTTDVQNGLEQVQETAQSTGDTIVTSANNSSAAVAQTGAAAEEAGNRGAKSFHRFGQSISQIGRMLKTMAIRTMLRSLIKAFSNAWTATYNYSKAMGGEFAENVEKARGAITSTAISMVTAFAPAMKAIVPVLNTIAGAVQFLSQKLQELFQLLNIGSEFFGVATETINEYANAAGSGSQNTKSMVAAFDELNIINSSGNGSGGSGNGNAMIFSDAIEGEMGKINAIVAESMIGIGLILALMGHVPLGVGMIALGAAAMVKIVVNDWGKLTQDTQNEIATIMTIAGGAMLALGLILAFNGHIPLGIAAIALGIANLVGVVAISNTLSDDVKGTISSIMAIAGASLLAIGIILTCCGVYPLGIGMIIAGGVSLATAVALNWDEIVDKVSGIIGNIATLFINAWNSIKDAITGAWNAVKKWWEENIISKVKNAWESATTWLADAWNNIKSVVGSAWSSVSNWFSARWSDIKSGWEDIKSGISGVWNTVSGAVSGAWESTKNWFSAKWSDLKDSWENIKGGLSGIWDGIKSSISGAWDKYMSWTGVSWSDIKSSWENVKSGLSTAWDDVKSSVSNAWESVKQWWEQNPDFESKWSSAMAWLGDQWDTLKGKVTSAWSNVRSWWTTNIQTPLESTWSKAKSYLSGVWDAVKSKVTGAWANVKTWWGTNILTPLKQRWENGKEYLSGVWDAVKNKVSGAWSNVKTWWGTNVLTPLQNRWKNAKTYLSNVWDTIKNKVTGAWSNVKTWWTTNVSGPLKTTWDKAKSYLSGVWDTIKNKASGAWTNVKSWWSTNISTPISNTWKNIAGWFGTNVTEPIKKFFNGAWNDIKYWWNSNQMSGVCHFFRKAWSSVTTFFSNEVLAPIRRTFENAWTAISDWWNTGTYGAKSLIEGAWNGISGWFTKNVTGPIKDAFDSAIQWIKDRINDVIGVFNSIGDINFKGWRPYIPKNVVTEFLGIDGYQTIIPSVQVKLWHINKLAEGALDIPVGDLFIANEAGPELVGKMGQHNTVANQQQIVEGIRKGVADANNAQNELLREQNALLRQILARESGLKASAALGRVAQRSIDMYNGMVGG